MPLVDTVIRFGKAIAPHFGDAAEAVRSRYSLIWLLRCRSMQTADHDHTLRGYAAYSAESVEAFPCVFMTGRVGSCSVQVRHTGGIGGPQRQTQCPSGICIRARGKIHVGKPVRDPLQRRKIAIV